MNINTKNFCPLKTKNQLKRKSSFQPTCLNACFSFPNWNNCMNSTGLHWYGPIFQVHIFTHLAISPKCTLPQCADNSVIYYFVFLSRALWKKKKKKKELFKGEALWPYQCSLKLNSCKILCPLFPSLNKNFQNKLQKWINFTTRDIYFDQIYSLQRTKSPLSL